MGFIHDSYGPHAIGVEERLESFYIHPAYGFDVECPVCHGEPLMGGVCHKCDGDGRIDCFEKSETQYRVCRCSRRE